MANNSNFSNGGSSIGTIVISIIIGGMIALGLIHLSNNETVSDDSSSEELFIGTDSAAISVDTVVSEDIEVEQNERQTAEPVAPSPAPTREVTQPTQQTRQPEQTPAQSNQPVQGKVIKSSNIQNIEDI